MLIQPTQHSVGGLLFRLAAFGGAALVEILRPEDHHDRAGPIGDGVSEERAQVRFLAADRVEQNPQRQQGARDDAEPMPVEHAAAAAAWGKSASNRKMKLIVHALTLARKRPGVVNAHSTRWNCEWQDALS